MTVPAAQIAEDPNWVYRKKQLVIKAPYGTYTLDTSRFGRRFETPGARLRQVRLAQNVELAALARATEIDKGLLSRYETGHANDKLHMGPPAHFKLGFALHIDGAELYLQYVAAVHPLMRAVYFPDDPGVAGPQFGLPLGGSMQRLIEREKKP